MDFSNYQFFQLFFFFYFTDLENILKGNASGWLKRRLKAIWKKYIVKSSWEWVINFPFWDRDNPPLFHEAWQWRHMSNMWE